MVEAHVVSEFCIGNTCIKIADNAYRGITPCQVEQRLAQIARRAQRHFTEPPSTEQHEPKEDTKIPSNGSSGGSVDDILVCGSRGGRRIRAGDTGTNG